MNIPEKIVDNVSNALKTITIANGFPVDAIVKDARRAGNHVEDRLVLIKPGDDVPRDDSPIWKTDYDKSFELVCIRVLSDGSERTDDAAARELAAACQAALAKDYGRGGWAMNTEFGAISAIQDDTHAAATLPFTVLFRTARDNLFSK